MTARDYGGCGRDITTNTCLRRSAQVVNYYFSMLQARGLGGESLPRVHCFSSFFYSRLMDCDATQSCVPRPAATETAVLNMRGACDSGSHSEARQCEFAVTV